MCRYLFKGDMEVTENLVKKYFSYGLQQQEIIAYLRLIHNITVSQRTLKRILAKLQLFRRKKYSKIEDVYRFINLEINKSGQMHGYRWMHLKCLQNGLVVTQDIIREILYILDPQGVELRKRKRLRRRQYNNNGPNYLWHMDSYDKLKPYGICINGCIDGYSRYILWLRAGLTSSNPKVIGGYYLDAIKTVMGCPKTMRSDMGTENKTVEKFQKALHDLVQENPSDKPSFIYGRSTGNQRIESWWSVLRKQNTQYWINLFEMLRDDDLFNGTFVDKSLIQFCFMEIIQNELDEIVMAWNVHKIRGSRNSVSPTGRPVIMFEMPSLYGTRNYLVEVPIIAMNFLEDECVYQKYPCDKDVFDLCNDIMEEYGYSHGNDPYDAVQLYINLRRKINVMLEI